MYKQPQPRQASYYQEKQYGKQKEYQYQYQYHQQEHENRRAPQPRHIRFDMHTNYNKLYAEACFMKLERPRIKLLKCVFCKEEKQVKEFSEMQIAKATYNLYAPSVVTEYRLKYISCLKCTDTQRKTLTCWKCTKMKSLDQFSRMQRRNNERARCLQCMKKRNDEDVNDSEPEYSSEDDSLDNWDDYL
ncbi:Stc1 domain-containing protein [Phascolomyces articulosus]|uniref:Stc1 domain-containing protein n=1 Tax=Phascolomyces articulosus TaxID=60185 RepID=A0AAD5JWP1_9FUNG|nr:Stc1 domain-containing protein [Phascolomyces articulosus]